MFKHSTFSYDVPYAFRSDNCGEQSLSASFRRQIAPGSAKSNWCPKWRAVPSSFRMYFNANDRPVSFLSTMRTFPNAPRPTTRRRRKWLRFTAKPSVSINRELVSQHETRFTFTVKLDGLSLAVAHSSADCCWCPNETQRKSGFKSFKANKVPLPGNLCSCSLRSRPFHLHGDSDSRQAAVWSHRYAVVRRC